MLFMYVLGSTDTKVDHGKMAEWLSGQTGESLTAKAIKEHLAKLKQKFGAGLVHLSLLFAFHLTDVECSATTGAATGDSSAAPATPKPIKTKNAGSAADASTLR